jgi:hypothetical protein
MATTTGEEKPCEPFLVLFSLILATVLNQACHFPDPVLMSYFKYDIIPYIIPSLSLLFLLDEPYLNPIPPVRMARR